MPNVTINIIKGELAGGSYSFDGNGEVKIGRSSDNDCCLEGDQLVSRRHAVFIVSPPGVSIVDAGSTNGIEVNRRLYAKSGGNPLVNPMQLANGDVVRIGKSYFSVSVAQAGAKAADDGDATLVPAAASAPRMSNVGFDRDFSPDGSHTVNAPRIPGYDMGDMLGKGGMGAVYKAIMHNTGKVVAVKVMLPNVALNKKMVDTFHREIEVTKTVIHPNIVECYDDGVVGGSLLYLTLEFINGGDLVAYMDKLPYNRMPPDMAYPLMLQIAGGMGFAHSRNIVHRDIKPQNILLNHEGGNVSAKITDLGLAKNFEQAGLSGLTNSFTAGGTMAYMPPEQLTEFRDARPMSDVFSMAATFYEMLTGHIPYDFKKGRDKLRVIANGEMVPIENRGVQLPSRLVEVIKKALNVLPGDRYADGRELLAALKDAAP